MRSATAQRSSDRNGSAAPTAHLPLRRLVLCLDCEACFLIGPPSCPACSGRTSMPVATFLDERSRLLPAFRRFSQTRVNAVAKQRIIVARDQEKLYGDLRDTFVDNPTVDVVLDRRRSDRRRVQQSRSPERRRTDRRTLDIDKQLRTVGWVVVQLDAVRSVGLHPSPASTEDVRPRTPNSASAPR
jgi:hypothetical protein